MSLIVDEIAGMRAWGKDVSDWAPAVAARDAYIEAAEGVQGGRPVIRGTRLTVSAIHGRLSSGDSFDDLAEDYPDIPREALEAAFLYGETHPQLGRPARRRGAKLA